MDKQSQDTLLQHRMCAPWYRSAFASPGIIATVITASLLLQEQARAQYTESYTHLFNDRHVKNYSMELLPGTGKSAMAGTMSDPSTGDDNSIHFMLRQDGSPATTYVSKQYNDPGYDERAVGAHFIHNDDNDIAIIASGIDLGTVNQQDRIEVLRVNGSGNLTASYMISSYDLNMYPLGSLVVENSLYICGYTTKRTTTNYPNAASMASDKRIFILKFDLGSNTVTDSRWLNYNVAIPGMYDFDMATRIKKLKNGNLFVTGSCNTPHGLNYCATLSLVMDDQLNILYDEPFSQYTSPLVSSSVTSEYIETGFDIHEDPREGYFIFGNRSLAEDSLNPGTEFFQITYVDKDMKPVTANRYMFHDFDYAWGVNLVPAEKAGHVILSGYQSNRFSTSPIYLNWRTTSDNVNPFLAKYELFYDQTAGRIFAKPIYWSALLSAAGTGSLQLDTKSFSNNGGFYNNVGWAPPNAGRDLSYSDATFLSGPLYDLQGNGKLNVKTITTDKDGQMRFCPYDNTRLPEDHLYEALPGTVRALIVSSNFTSDNLYNTEQEADVLPDAILTCNDNNMFRPTGINTKDGTTDYSTISVAPNPAREYIILEMADQKLLSEQVTVSLYDIAGRHIAELYSGNGTGIVNRKLTLPVLSQGLYVVVLHNGRQQLERAKLEIK